MKKCFNWKQLIGKRIASLLMIFVMFMGVVPASVSQAVVGGISDVITAFAAEADGWYWEDSTLYIKDGSITGANFIKAVQEKTGSTLSTVYYSTSDLKNPAGFRLGGTEITSGTTYTAFENGTTYYASTYARSGLSVSGNATGAFTVKHYYVIKTAVAEGSPAGAGISITSEKVVSGDTVKITVNPVDGYMAKVTDSQGNGVTEFDNYAPTISTTLTVSYTQEQPGKVWLAEFGTGDGVVKLGGKEVTSTAAEYVAGEYVLTVEPTGYATGVYVKSVALNQDGNTISGTYDENGVFTSTQKVKVESGNEYTIMVEYGTETLTDQGNVLKLNGYEKKKFDDLKNNILNTVLGGVDNATNYNVQVWIDPIAGDPRYFNLDDKSTLGDWNLLTVANADRFTVPAYGTTGSLKVKITKKTTGQISELVLETTLTTKEAREPAEVILGSFEKEHDTPELFEEALRNAITVTDNAGAIITNDNAGLTVNLVPVDGAENTYEIKYTIANDGATWLATEGSLGEIVWKANEYTVTFLDWDGTVIQSETLPYGSAIVKPADPTRAADAQYTYAFAGWDTTVAETVTGNVTYQAKYTNTTNEYTVTWVVDGVETLETYEYGETPSYTGSTDKAADAQYTYTFAGWTPAVETVTGNATYTANYDKTVNQYTVTFVDEDGTELQSETLDYGTAIVAPADPTKAATAEWTYTFAGWTPAVAETVTGDVTYTATYSQTKNSYTVTWIVDGVTTTETLEYGTELNPANPTKEGYGFECWESNGKCVVFPQTVVGNVTYEAKFVLAVAKVGDTYYATWAAAYEAAQAGDTIVLLDDITLTGKLTIDKDITIEGNNHKIIANHKYFILETSSDCTLRNVTLDTNNMAKGVKIASGNVVFDNVTIPNSNKSDAITVYGSLTLKTYFSVESTYQVFDARSGSVTAAEGTVFDFTSRIGLISAASDLTKAVGTDGKAFFVAYAGSTYYKTITSLVNGLTLLKDATVANSATVSGKVTIDLSGYTLTVADGKAINVNKGSLELNNGTVQGSIVMNDPGDSVVSSIQNLNVSVSEDLKTRGYVVEYTQGMYCVNLPAPNAIVTDIKNTLTANDPDLTFALNFAFPADLTDAYINELFEVYGDWYTDYVLTITGLTSESVTFNADGKADGYLAGQYDGWSENWVSVPFENVTVKNGESLLIMQTAAEMLGQSGLRMTLLEIANVVTNFDCGVYFTPEFLAANPNLEVNLELRVFAEAAQHGFDYVIPVATSDFENNYAAAVVSNGQTQYFDTLNAAIEAAQSGETVKLLKDAENVNATVSQSIIIDANNCAITGSVTLGALGVEITVPESIEVATNVDRTAVRQDAEGKYYLVERRTVTFVDGDGNAVQSGDYDMGTVPTYEGATPTKTADAQYTYTFARWDKEIVAVTGDVTYTALFDATVNSYTVTWVVDGKTTQETYEYGTTPSFKGSTDKATVNYIKYTFAGWDKAVAAVTGDVTYTAQYNAALLANNSTVEINKYYTNKSDKAALTGLRTKILTAAGLSTSSNFVVTAVIGIQSAGDWATLTVEINDSSIKVVKGSDWLSGIAPGTLANELNKNSYSFTITETNSGVSKTVSMWMTDSRPDAPLYSQEITEVKVFGKEDDPQAYVDACLALVNPNGLNVTVACTEGDWAQAVPGVAMKFVYTVSYADDATYKGGSATLTVYMESLLNNCTVVAGDSLTAGGSLTVNGSSDNKTVVGNSTASITVKPNSGKYIETITVYKNDTLLATFNTNQISYSSGNATVEFKVDGTEIADVYTVEVEYFDNYLTLVSGTIVYCVDNDTTVTNSQLKEMIFNAIFGGSSAPMNVSNVTLEYAYVGALGVNLWQDISKGPAINLGDLTHKFGEKGSETIRIKYSDAKYGSFEQTVTLNVFDSCYSATVAIQTVAPAGTQYDFSVKYSKDSRKFEGTDYFKAGEELTVTLTPSGDDIGAILGQLYNKTYSETSPYIKTVKVMKKNADGSWAEVASTFARGNGELIDWDDPLSGVSNPFAYTAEVTFTTEADAEYKLVAEYDVLELERYEQSAQMEMYKGGKDYDAKVPSAQEIVNKILGEAYAANFLATYGGAWTVEFSTDAAQSSWTVVTDEALLALYDGTTVRVRITWNPTDDNKTYYPVSQQADLTLVDLRKATSVQGSIPTEAVEYIEESQLVANMKEAMGLGILSNGVLLDVEYDVNYTIEVFEEGNKAKVIVTYHGSNEYKPTTKTFENVPVADIPDNATIDVEIAGAAVIVTNNAGTAMIWDPSSGLYTVIGNGTYNFQLTPAAGKAIEAVWVNGEKLEAIVGTGRATMLYYNNGVATFQLYLDEKAHYDITVETVDSVFVLDDERIYNFAYGVEEPRATAILNAVINYPTDIDLNNVNLEYLARTEGTVTITIPTIDLGFTNLELGTFDVELGELWLDVNAEVEEYDLNKLADELVNELIEKIGTGEVGVTDAYSYVENKLKSLTLGAHVFGSAGDASVETIRISYADDKYNLAEVVTDVTIKDNRIATEILANDCTVTYGYSLEQLIAASGAGVYADGALVNGLKIETKDLYKHAGEQTITLYFAGDKDYQPCQITLNVTVNKASVSINYDSQMVTYGDAYDFNLIVSPEKLADGTLAEVELIEFMIGLDMHTLLDFGSEQDIVGLGTAAAFIQLRLPKSIRELPLVGQYLQGEFTLTEFTNLINSLSDSLGIDAGSMETLNQVVEAITGFTDRMEIKIIIKDEDFHPTNIGVYVAGAVTVDADFETAYTADYLIIKPQITEVELAWNTAIDNYVTTLPTWNAMDKGASIVGEQVDGLAVKYLLLGINTDSSEFLTTDIYGNIKANIWVDPSQVTDNGVYVQIAYGVLWGNTLYYTMPIVRAFAIVPDTVDVELRDEEGNASNDMTVDFNNKPQGFDVYVNGELANDSEWLTVYYAGIQSNGQVYYSNERPVHAGVYGVIATYIEWNDDDFQLDLENLKPEDLYQLFDIINIGADVGILTILPADSNVQVEDVVDTFTPENSYNPNDQVNASSKVEGLTPDTTVITVGIDVNGDYTAINGKVNVDLPRWVDELIAKYAPSIVDGITVSNFAEKFSAKLPEMLAALEAEGATPEVLDMFTTAVETVIETLEKLPADMQLSFTNEFEVTEVGVYAVIAIVTDSDHYPSVDAGLLVVTPDVQQVKLTWNFEDSNGIFTRDLLEAIDFDLAATAYANGVANAEATNKITYQFIGINSDAEVVVYTNPETLPNGAYVQLAYIAFELNDVIYISDMIARPVVIMASNCNVNVEDLNTVFNGTQQGVSAEIFDLNGNLIDATKGEITYIYAGLQTNGKTYLSKEAPVHAGLYEVIAIYVEYDENGELRYYGVGFGTIVIDLAQSSIDVTGGEYVYDGNDYTVDVNAKGESIPNVDYILISGGAYVSTEIDKVGIDALYGNVNVDFPRWVDAILANYEVANGVSPAYLISFINGHKAEILDVMPEFAADKVEAYIDELIAVLGQLSENVTLTFEDNVAYTHPGYYFYYGIVADSDHYPSTDTGLVVINKADGIIYDLLNTTVNYSGESQTVEVKDPDNANAIIVVIDRKNNVINVRLDSNAQYVVDILADILGFATEGEADLAEILNAYKDTELANAISKLFAKMQQLEENEEVAKALAALQAELDKLPTYGTLAVNGDMPVNVGEYEVYAVVYSEYYNTVCSEAVLEIIPAEVTVTVITDNIHVNEIADSIYEVEVVAGAYAGEIAVEIVYMNANGEIVTEFTVPGEYTATAICTAEDENCIITVVAASFTVEDHIGGEAVAENKVEPTCTAEGSYESVVYCRVCGEELSRETKTIEKLPHTQGEVVVENEVEPTCTVNGSYDNVVYCSVCGEELSRETIVVPALGHSYKAVVTAPTCTEDGYTTYTCSVCGDSYVADYVDALGHTEVILSAVEPTCTATGLTAGKYCSVCAETLVAQEVVPAKGHTAGAVVVENNVEPTCTAKGSYDNVVYCTVCGEELSRETISVPAKGHRFSNLVVTSATCTEAGWITITCGDCGEVFDSRYDEEAKQYLIDYPYFNLAAKGHTDENDDNICDVCDAVLCEGDDHNYVGVVTAPTCTEQGYTTYTCSACGVSYVADYNAAKGHRFSNLVVTPATCTEAGWITITCGDCGKVFDSRYDDEAKQYLIDYPFFNLAAKGHTEGAVVVENNVAPTCTKEGSYDNVVYCTVCGAQLSKETVVVPMLKHTYESVVTAPTFDAEGYTTHTCTVCGDSYTTDKVPALQCALTVDGVKFESWADAKASIKKNSTIKLYADVEYGIVDGKRVEHKFPANGGSIVLDLNGFDLTFHYTVTVQYGTQLTITDSTKTGSTFKTTAAAYPFTLGADVKVYVENGVKLDGTVQMTGLSGAQKPNYLFVDGECIIGTDNALFETNKTTVRLDMKDDFSVLNLKMGNVTLTKNLETLAGQSITISAGTGLTIPENVTLTVNPETNLTLNGTVQGEGTVVVADGAHLKQVLENTTVANVVLAADVTANGLNVAYGREVTLDLNGYTINSDLTVAGKLTVIDSTVDGTNFREAGMVNGTLTVEAIADLTLCAGTYTRDVIDYCNAGYASANNGDGTWTIVLGILTVNDVAFATWAEAAPYIGKNASIKLYADVEYGIVDGKRVEHKFPANGGSIVLDLNGFDLTFHHTVTVRYGTQLTITDSTKTGSTFKTTAAAYPFVLGADVKVYVENGVKLDGTVQMTGLSGAQKPNYLFVDGECIVGTDNALFETNKTTVRLETKDNFSVLNLKLGNVTLTKNLETLAGQSITIGKDTGLTIPENVTLTVDPETNLTLNGTVQGEGTVVVSTLDHLLTVLKDTDVKNVQLANVIVAGNELVDLNGKTLYGTVLGAVKSNGGLWVTAEGYKMIGVGADYYLTDDATVTVTASDLTINEGVVTLAQSWRTLPGQNINVAEDATFVVPAGMTFQIYDNTNVTVDGTATVEGAVELRLGATLKAAENLNVTSGVEGYCVAYANGVYSLMQHNYVGVVTAPTCTEGGYTTYTCDNCGDSYVADYVDALGHTEVIDAAVAPTCTATGLTEGTHCSVCGEVFVAQQIVPAKGHRFSNLVVTSATCTEEGWITITCGDCNEVFDSRYDEEAKQYLIDYPFFNLAAKGHTEGAVVVENEIAATPAENGSYDNVVYCTECGVELSRETIIVPATGVVAIGETKYASLAAAITAAKAGDTIIFLADITENVTVSKSVTIDGADYNYTGTMTLGVVTVTIENVNFVAGSIYARAKGNYTIKGCDFDGQGLNGYALNLGQVNSVVIEDVTAKAYGYGFLQMAKSNNSISLKNVEITNVSGALKIDYSNNVTLEDVTIENATYGIYDTNYGTKTYTIKNSTIDATYPIYVREKNVAVIDTFKFEGDNSFGATVFTVSELANLVLDTEATLEACEGLNVTTGAGYYVDYENGKYVVKEALVKIDDKYFGTLVDAAEVVQNGETIELLKDITLKSAVMFGSDVAVKATIDLAGHTLTAKEVVITSFRAGTEITFTNGTIAGNSTGGTLRATYKGKLILGDNITVISGGNADAIELSSGVLEVIEGATVTVDGGINCLETAGETANSVVITGGTFTGMIVINAQSTCVITGGTFTQNVQQWCAIGYACKDNKDGTYTVINAVAKIGEAYYATLADAIAAATDGNKIELLWSIEENVTVDKSLTIDGADFNYTGKMTLNKVNVTIENVNFVKGSIYKNKKTGAGGTYTIKNCTFDGQGMEDYAINLGGTSAIVIENVTAKDYGYGLLQVPATNNSVTVKNVTIENVNYGIKVDYSNSVTLENVTIKNATYGIMDSNFGAKTYTLKNCTILDTSKPIYVWDRKTNVVDTFVFEGTNKVAKLEASAYAKYVLGAVDATLEAPAGLTVTTNVAVSVVKYDGTKYYVQGAVAEVGGNYYGTLAEAIAAATAGQTVVLLADIKEDVTVGKSLTIDGADFNYTGNIAVSGATTALTVKNVKFVNGDYYAIKTDRIKSITVEDCTVDNYGYGFLYANKSTPTVVVKNVEVSNCNYGLHYVYGTKATLENVTMTNVASGILTQNYGAKTITIKNSTISSIELWDRNTTVVNTLVFEGANTVGVIENNACLALELANVAATLKAPAGLEVTTDAEGYYVDYEDGVYVAKEAVAQVGNKYYGSFVEAINAAVDGDTVVLLKNDTMDGSTTVYDNTWGYEVYILIEEKSITVDFNGNTVSVIPTVESADEGIENCVEAIILLDKGASLTLMDSSEEANGGITVNKGTIDLYCMIYNCGSTLTIENGVYNVEATITAGSIIYSEDEGTAHSTTINDGTFTLGNASADGTTTKPWIFNTEGKNDTFIYVFGGTYNQNIMMNYGSQKDCEVELPDGYWTISNGDGTWTVKAAAAKNGETYYATLQAAIDAATAGDTIELVSDITEDVTVSKSLTIDGADFNYTGNISVSGKTTALTVKNVNFVDGTGYAIKTDRIKSITVEDCTVDNYGYGFLYANKSTPTVVVKNVEVSNCNYGLHYVYGTKATLENVTMTNVASGILTQNYGAKTYTIKNSTISSIQVWEKGTATDTFVFEGANTVGEIAASNYMKLKLGAVDATLKAVAGLTVTTDVEGCYVDYVDGKYVVKKAIAEVGNKYYGSLQEAINAAADGETVTLLQNINIAESEVQILGEKYNTLFTVSGKTITVDLNGKTISGEYTLSDMLVGVFSTENNGHMTLTGNGIVEVTATTTVYALLVNYDATSTFVIENGTYKLDKAKDALIYSGGSGVTVNDGYFYLGNVGTGSNGQPWLFNAKGQNTNYNTVNGGTFNADINHQYWAHEVEIPETKALKNNGNGTWTVVPAVAYVVENSHGYDRKVGYATFAEAYEAVEAGKTVGVLENVTIDMNMSKNVTVMGNGKVTVAEGVVFTAGTYDWNVQENCAKGYVSKAIDNNMWTVEMDIKTQVTANASLDFYFAFSADLVEDWTGYYVILNRHHTMEGETDEELQLYVEDWGKTMIAGGRYYTVYCPDVYAYHMCDEFTFNLYDPNGELVGTKTDSMKDWAKRMYDTAPADVKAAYIDLLNYGAAAQLHFDTEYYECHDGELVNAGLAEEGYIGSIDIIPPMENKQAFTEGQNVYGGSNIKVSSHIEFMFRFRALSENMYATISYTNYQGKALTARVELESAEGGKAMYLILNDQVQWMDGNGNAVKTKFSISDVRELLTINVYAEVEGVETLCVSMVDSMESYCARMSKGGDIFEAFMKFADSLRKLLGY